MGGINESITMGGKDVTNQIISYLIQGICPLFYWNCDFDLPSQSNKVS